MKRLTEKLILKEDDGFEVVAKGEETLPDVAPTDFEIPVEDEIKPEELEDEPSKEDKNSGISMTINSLIVDEFEAVDGYTSALTTLRELDNVEYEPIIKNLQDILEEENVHIGQLQEILKIVSPSANAIEDGKEEAEDSIEGEEGSEGESQEEESKEEEEKEED